MFVKNNASKIYLIIYAYTDVCLCRNDWQQFIYISHSRVITKKGKENMSYNWSAK